MTFDFLPGSSPVVVALAGSNGAGKSTFYAAFLADSALPFVNADVIARELGLPADEAAEAAARARQVLIDARESFIFETVFSDPVGDKVAFLKAAAAASYTVVLLFIGIESPAQSQQRVWARVAQGGHDVPSDKIAARFDRTLENLVRAIDSLPHVLVYDNSRTLDDFPLIAQFREGRTEFMAADLPGWFEEVLSRRGQ